MRNVLLLLLMMMMVVIIAGDGYFIGRQKFGPQWLITTQARFILLAGGNIDGDNNLRSCQDADQPCVG